MPAFVKALNNVDFPTFGKPTIPHFKLMTASQRQAGKCMPSLWCVFACCLMFACGGAAAATSRPAVALSDQQPQVEAPEIGTALLDARGGATIDHVVQGTAGPN